MPEHKISKHDMLDFLNTIEETVTALRTENSEYIRNYPEIKKKSESEYTKAKITERDSKKLADLENRYRDYQTSIENAKKLADNDVQYCAFQLRIIDKFRKLLKGVKC